MRLFSQCILENRGKNGYWLVNDLVTFLCIPLSVCGQPKVAYACLGDLEVPHEISMGTIAPTWMHKDSAVG